MKELILYSNTDFYKSVLNYIYEKYNDKFNSFEYLAESTVKPYEYVRRNEINKIKVCIPSDTSFDIDFKDKKINFILDTLNDSNGNIYKMIVPGPGCHSSTHKEIVYKKIVML